MKYVKRKKTLHAVLAAASLPIDGQSICPAQRARRLVPRDVCLFENDKTAPLFESKLSLDSLPVNRRKGPEPRKACSERLDALGTDPFDVKAGVVEKTQKDDDECHRGLDHQRLVLIEQVQLL